MPLRRSFRGRFQRTKPEAGDEEGVGGEFIAIETEELDSVFTPPAWLRDLGSTAWLLVGVTVLLVGIIWLLTLTSTIVVPVLTATIIAAVVSPIVSAMERRRVPRGIGALIVFLCVAALGALVAVMVLSGIVSQSDSIERSLGKGVHTLQGWLADAGVSDGKAQSAADGANAGVSDAFHALISGAAAGIKALASLAVFVSFAALALFFLLKDGPAIKEWTERHMGVPKPVAGIITDRTLQALRGYFAGVTAIAAFSAIIIGLAAVVLDVPVAGTIAVVNFLAGYIPFLGAWAAGAFTVLIALGANGTETAIAMAVVVLLANGALQQMVQPIAYGATLGIHPLAALIVTIAGGSLFGTIGLVLAAPLVSAGLRISSDLARARAHEKPAPPAAAAASEAGSGENAVSSSGRRTR